MWRPERLPRFTSETEAKAWLVTRLEPHVGRLASEVHMQHPLRDDQRPLRMDYAAVISNFRPASDGPWLIGLEVKAGNDDAWRQWVRSLCQATAYRYARVCDKRSVRYRGQQPSYVFAWPDPRDLADWDPRAYLGWLDGAERLAGRFNVGTVRYRGRGELLFCCSANPLWSTIYGPHSAPNFGTRMQVGSR